MKITSEIFMVGGAALSSPEDACVYIVCFNGKAALIDSGAGNSVDKIINNIQKIGIDPLNIEYLLLTHCHFDHTGGAKEIKDKLKCKIVAHNLDAIYLENGDNIVTAANWYNSRIKAFTVDIKLNQKEEDLKLGNNIIQAIHAPGHSPGSLVFLTRSDNLNILFAQDVHGPLHPSLKSNKADYINSLKKLLELEIDILCEGHYGVIPGREKINDFINSYIV